MSFLALAQAPQLSENECVRALLPLDYATDAIPAQRHGIYRNYGDTVALK